MEKLFFEKVKEGSDFLKERDDFVVCHHYDADGITSGSIVTKSLQRLGKNVKPFGIKQLYSDTINEIKSIGQNIVFTDFGSSYINELREAFGIGKFMVIDHHQKGSGEYQFHVNPMEFGIEGGSSISSSGIAYLIAKAIDQKNMDLASIGIVGAVGDMQDFNTGKLVGLNEEILIHDAQLAGVLDKKIDLRLYGRISRPLVQFLMFSTSPLLPMLTGNEENCIKFLQNNKIPLKEGDSWNSYEDLSPENKQKLSTALILHLTDHRVPEWKIKELIGEVYTLTKEEFKSPLRDAKEYSTVLNACLVPGSEVYLNGTPTKIEEINSETVFSVEDGKIIRDHINEKHKIPLPDSIKLLEIKTQTGRKIRLTQNHELLSLIKGQQQWTAAEYLEQGSFIAISKTLPNCSKKFNFWDFFKKEEIIVEGDWVKFGTAQKAIKIPVFNRDLGFLIGYIAGDGHLAHSYIDIAFSKKPRDVFSFNEIKRIFEEQFGAKSPTISDHSNYFNAIWSSVALVEFFNRIGIAKGKKAPIIHFHPSLLEAEQEFVKGLMTGLISSDGNIYAGGIEFASHSEKLVSQFIYLLQQFGIISHVTSRKCADCSGLKYRLLICGKVNIQKFASEIGFSYPEVNKELYRMTEKFNPINSHELYLPIREKLLELGELLTIPTKWSSHFTHYKNGKQPSIENVKKYVNYFEQQIQQCEIALEEKNLNKVINAFNMWGSAFGREARVSFAWLYKIQKGRKPEKNALKKIENGFEQCKKKVVRSKLILNEIKKHFDSDIYWDKIKEINVIEKDRPEFVYDITVAKNHNYIANGIVVHNCGRHKMSHLGLQVCLGDRGEYYGRALGMLQDHRRQLAQGIQFVKERGLEEMKGFYFFDATTSTIQESIVGIIAGMLYSSGIIQPNKPIIAFAKAEDGNIKVSGRATTELTRRGVNLGKSLKEVCNELSEYAEGGGHVIAAGCRIKSDEQKLFLEKLNESILKSMNST